MKSWKLTFAAFWGLTSLGGLASAQSFPVDTAHYHGGAVLSPNIKCLLWTPSSSAYSGAEIQSMEDYLVGVQQYLSNAAAPPGSNGAGTEAVPRQYGVWGAYFSGTCQQDTTAPYVQYVNLNDHSATSAIYHEINTVYGAGAYSPNDLVVVFTRGWPYDPSSPTEFAQHWSPGPSQYVAAVATDTAGFEIVAHEIIEASTDADYGAWHTDQNATDIAPCGSSWGNEVCDDGGGTVGLTLQTPLPDGFGNSGNPFVMSDATDNIDGSNSTWTCGGTNTCAAVGNFNQCPQGNGVQTVLSGNAFTNMTTSFPVTVVQTGAKTNVLMRTPGGIAHLVSTDAGASYTQVASPVGSVTEVLAAYTSDGTSIDMYGRGLDGALYRWVYDGSTWSAPAWVGGYLLGPPSAAFVNINGWQHGLVWVTQNDRQIYYWVTGGGWFYANMPANVRAMSPPQIFPRNNTIDIYFTGTDGHVYVDAGWTGGWQKLPGDGYGTMMATTRPGDQTRADVFVKEPIDQGGSYTWWSEMVSGSVLNNSKLTGLPMGSGPTAAVNYANSAEVWLLFAQSNQLYIATSDSNGTTYTNRGPLGGVPAVSSPATTFAPDSNTVLVFVRSQSNGHLIQLRWVGDVLQQPVQDLGVSIM